MSIDEDILGQPTKEEKTLVEKFFRKNIEKTKDISTEIIYLWKGINIDYEKNIIINIIINFF